LAGNAIRNTVYLSKNGVACSNSEVLEGEPLTVPVLLNLEKTSDGLNSIYIGSLDIISVNKKKVIYSVISTLEGKSLEDIGVQILPADEGSFETGSKKISFKFETIPGAPFEGVKVILTGDKVTEYCMIFMHDKQTEVKPFVVPEESRSKRPLRNSIMKSNTLTL
jgi:hypothetical protein